MQVAAGHRACRAKVCRRDREQRRHLPQAGVGKRAVIERIVDVAVERFTRTFACSSASCRAIGRSATS